MKTGKSGIVQYNMKYCKSCGVYIRDVTDICPLCGSVLTGDDPGVTLYPDVVHKNKIVHTLFKILLVCGIAVSALCVYLDFNGSYQRHWSLIVTACFAYSIAVCYQLIMERMHYRIRIFGIAICTFLLCWAIDWINGLSYWSINFVLPTDILAVEFFLVLLMIINQRNRQSYLILEAGMVLIGIIPLTLAFAGIGHRTVLDILAFAVPAFIFIATLIFGGKAALSELRRRFRVY